MATSTDAQRLIAMSLGKIAASRGQRGGINLHKNLLVASVLHKARTIYMLENYHNMMETRRLQLGSQESAVQPSENRENMLTNDHEVPCLPGSGSPAAAVTPPPQQEQESSIIGKPSCMFASSCDNGDENKENAPVQQQPPCLVRDNEEEETNKEDCSDMSLDCAPCAKRRLSEVTDNDSQVVPCAKKLKLDSDMESSVDSVELLPKSCEQVQTNLSRHQMKSLVHSFNSGFTGLLNVTDNTTTSSDCSQSSQDQGYSSADEDDEDDVFVSNQSTCQKPENSLISCSTQIKEAFETLARPIIALTV